MNIMKRTVAFCFTFLILTSQVFAQQWGMDEAYEDWRDTRTESFSVGGLFVLAVLVGVVLLISKGLKAVKEEHARNLELRTKNEKKTEDIVSKTDQIINSINQKKQ